MQSYLTGTVSTPVLTMGNSVRLVMVRAQIYILKVRPQGLILTFAKCSPPK